MNDLREAQELEVLWRMAARRTPAEHGKKLVVRLDALRPRLMPLMRDMILQELDEDGVSNAPTQEDLMVLLGSEDPRVRVLGMRLAAQVAGRTPGPGPGFMWTA